MYTNKCYSAVRKLDVYEYSKVIRIILMWLPVFWLGGIILFGMYGTDRILSSRPRWLLGVPMLLLGIPIVLAIEHIKRSSKELRIFLDGISLNNKFIEKSKIKEYSISNLNKKIFSVRIKFKSGISKLIFVNKSQQEQAKYYFSKMNIPVIEKKVDIWAIVSFILFLIFLVVFSLYILLGIYYLLVVSFK